MSTTAKKNTLLIKRLGKKAYKDRHLWLIALPGIIYFIIFHYIPMYGVSIAFKNFSISKGITGSEWAGFKYFVQFFTANDFWRILRNTMLISFYALLFGFPAPIVLALVLNECRFTRFRKTVQTISYMPHFLSTVIVVGVLINMVNPVNGIVNEFIKLSGGKAINFMANPIGSGLFMSYRTYGNMQDGLR